MTIIEVVETIVKKHQITVDEDWPKSAQEDYDVAVDHLEGAIENVGLDCCGGTITSTEHTYSIDGREL